MKYSLNPCAAVLLVIACLIVNFPAWAADKKSSAKSAGSQTVDSGSFSIFVKGNKVATETFTIQQQTSSSVIKAQLKETNGSDASSQKSDLEITQKGEIVRYDWSQSSGGSLTVMPNNEFLLEKITTPASSKPAEQPFLMPNTSVILDNNFFVHREVLVWRFLASACKPQGGSMNCQKEPADFGVIVPQDRNSEHVRLELVGKEKISVRGTDRDLMRLNLKGDDFEWALWVDEQDQFKLIKVAIPADSTEVVRD